MEAEKAPSPKSSDSEEAAWPSAAEPPTQGRRTSTSSTAASNSSKNRGYALKKWEKDPDFQLEDFGKVFEVVGGVKGTGMPPFVISNRNFEHCG